MRTILLGLGLIVAADDNRCPSFAGILGKSAKWDDITATYESYNIAANTKTDIVWSTLNKKFLDDKGHLIAKYDHDQNLWKEAGQQPVGADYGPDSLAVD